MKFDKKEMKKNVFLLVISGIGGYFLSLTGISIGWMLGAMLISIILSVKSPQILSPVLPQKVFPFWKTAGQVILAVQVGKHMNSSVLQIFRTNWSIIISVLLLSLLVTVVLGFILWRFSNVDIMTALYATTPGGVSNMPSLAQEVGANPITVTSIQTMRILLVVSIIPFLVMNEHYTPLIIRPQNHSHSILLTFVLVLAAIGGYYVGKRLKLPAPRLVGGILGVALIESVSSYVIGDSIFPWFPSWLKILSQIFLGTSIGCTVNREMFVGMKNTIVAGFLNAILLVFIMLGVSIIVSRVTGIPLVTSILAFAPGGVAEMAVTAVSMKADASFVVAVQTLRLISIFLILPPLFQFLNRILSKRSYRSTIEIPYYFG